MPDSTTTNACIRVSIDAHKLEQVQTEPQPILDLDRSRHKNRNGDRIHCTKTHVSYTAVDRTHLLTYVANAPHAENAGLIKIIHSIPPNNTHAPVTKMPTHPPTSPTPLGQKPKPALPQEKLDPRPQRLTLLQHLPLQPDLLQQQQRLRNSRRITLATEDLPLPAAGVVEPAPNKMQHVNGDVTTIAALERSFVIVEHALQDGKDGFVGDLQFQEQIHDPRSGADASLVFERVSFQQGHEHGDREGAFRQVQAAA